MESQPTKIKRDADPNWRFPIPILQQWNTL